MKIEKILNEITKDVMQMKHVRYHICRTDDYVLVYTGHVVYRIPSRHFLLDFDKLNIQEAGNPIKGINENDFHAGVLTGTIRKIMKDRKVINYVEIKHGDNEYMYFDEKLAQYFDVSHIKVKDSYNAILVYENKDDFAGIVMPFKMPGEGTDGR